MTGVYTSLSEILDPARSSLLVIDIQNDFVHPQGWSARRNSEVVSLRRVIEPINELINAARESGVLVTYVLMQHGPDIDSPNYRARYADRGMTSGDLLCKRGTWGALLDVELNPPQGDDAQIVRHTYDGFAGTSLHEHLRARGVETVVATGVVTELCVRTTVEHAFALGYYTIVVEDATESSSATVREVTLDGLRKYFGPVVSSEEIIQRWTGGHSRSNSGRSIAAPSGGAERNE